MFLLMIVIIVKNSKILNGGHKMYLGEHMFGFENRDSLMR